MTPPTILFAGGGTGGHLFPALAIADALRDRIPAAECRFICSDRPIDHAILNDARADHAPARSRPFSLRPKGLLQFLASWGPSVHQSRALISGNSDWSAASVLIAMGGYVAAPSVRGARAERTPVVLINLDAVPGKANRWCARHAQVSLTAAEGERVPKAWQRIRPIVRTHALATTPPDQARRSFDLDPDTPTLLVTGGSQGARSINQLLIALAENEPGSLTGWQILHQCGHDESSTLQRRYDAAGIHARVLEFIDRVGDAWAAADLSVARCGAGTVAEVWANHVPTLFLPYPYHRDEHQRHNARPLAECDGAVIETDAIDPRRNLDSVGPALRDLLANDQRRLSMRAALQRLGPPDGADAAAKVVSDLISSRT